MSMRTTHLKAAFSAARAACLSLVVLLLSLVIAFPVAHAKKKPPATPLDLNMATSAQLEELPGIGPAAARAIVDFRTKSGRFQRVEDLLAIRGVSQRKLDALRPYVRVSAPSPASQAPKKDLGLSRPKGAGPEWNICD
jgi:competence ComEA-like helix-hairpin-helix protein